MNQDLYLLSYLIICASAFLASGLTLFTGFGLGTLLMPVFAIFFPVNIAISLTALVHLTNNLFKLSIFGRHAHWKTVIYFGIPAFLASLLGAACLVWFSGLNPIVRYKIFGKEFEILPINIVMSILMIIFAMLELVPKLQGNLFRRSSPQVSHGPLGLRQNKYLAIGGVLSGFFGGLSGHQGAFRSAFLIKMGLSKECFIGTGVVIACFVDIVRIFVYGRHLILTHILENGTLLLCATLSALVGISVGSLWLKKITIKNLQILVAFLLFIIAIVLGTGLLSSVHPR
jgi:uncharacterized membrane protein YfcA